MKHKYYLLSPVASHVSFQPPPPFLYANNLIDGSALGPMFYFIGMQRVENNTL